MRKLIIVAVVKARLILPNLRRKLCQPIHPSIALLFFAAVNTQATLGQSLSIHRNGENKTWIEANSQFAIGYRVQASAKCQNWEDISDQISGPLTYRIDRKGETNRFFRLRTWTLGDAPLTLVIIGDSTTADFEMNLRKFSGWGQGIHGYLKPHVRVVNLALAGQSTKVFLKSLQRQHLVRIEPDFVLVHFGCVDATWLGDDEKTSYVEYEANLKEIVEEIRKLKGTPILVTPVMPRMKFDDKNMVVPYFEDRSRVMKVVAAEQQTYLIDLNQLSRDLYNELGESKSAFISWSSEDRVHFSLEGAAAIAGLVVHAFPSILRPHILATGSGTASPLP